MLMAAYTLRQACTDGPFAWTAAYEVRPGEGRCTVTVALHLCPAPGVEARDLARVRQTLEAETARYFDGVFVLETPSGHPLTLHVGLRWTAAATAGLPVVELRPGDGQHTAICWYAAAHPLNYVHELAHLLGLCDEYYDPAVPGRDSPAAPGVWRDHSLMGNYVVEGMRLAALRLRHGQCLADAIGALLGERLVARFCSHYTVRPGDSLSWIAGRYTGDPGQWTALYALNRDGCEDPHHPLPGTVLALPAHFLQS
ncbi:MAG: hypothetical protein OHK0039_14400 [Bacteroidia bacterium]